MKTMNLELSQEQYKTLLQMAYIGQYVTMAWQEEEASKYEQMEQYIYSYAKDFGMEEWITFTEEEQGYMPTATMEEEVLPILEEFEESSFWESLSWRLAERDIIEDQGLEKFAKMELDEQFNLMLSRSDEYVEEFEENGLARLLLKND